MRRFSLIVLTVILFCSFTISQTHNSNIEWNGYDWEDTSDQIKLGYIVGFKQGTMHSVGYYNTIILKDELLTQDTINSLIESHWQKFRFSEATNGQIMEGVDEAYKDFSNKLIPVHQIMNLVCKKIRGELSNDEYEKELQRLRAEASKK